MRQNPEELDPSLEEDRPAKKKRFFKEALIASFGLAAIFVTVFLVEYFPAALYGTYPLRCYADSFGVAGILGICFWLLLFVSSKGALDMLVYSIKKVWVVTFNVHPEKASLPDTFYEYEQEKRGKPAKRFFGVLAISGVFFLLGLILTFVSLGLEY
jgi:hypothetical protein